MVKNVYFITHRYRKVDVLQYKVGWTEGDNNHFMYQEKLFNYDEKEKAENFYASMLLISESQNEDT